MEEIKEIVKEEKEKEKEVEEIIENNSNQNITSNNEENKPIKSKKKKILYWILVGLEIIVLIFLCAVIKDFTTSMGNYDKYVSTLPLVNDEYPVKNINEEE